MLHHTQIIIEYIGSIVVRMIVAFYFIFSNKEHYLAWYNERRISHKKCCCDI